MEQEQPQAVKRKSPALLIIVLTVLFVAAAGTVSAFLFLNKSPKVQYLLAETKTISQMNELLQARYQNEADWMEVQKKKPVETIYDLSAEWNDPYVDYDMEEIQSIVNSVKIQLGQVKDPVKKEWETNARFTFGNIDSELGKLFITPERLLLALPFTDQVIRFDDKDYGKFMRETDDPDAYTGEETLGLSHLFEEKYGLSEEFRNYVQKEYFTYLYEELPKDAFTSEKEQVDVFGEKLKTQRVTMALTEEEVKSLLKNLFQKARNDEKLKALIKEQLSFSSMADEMTASDLTEMIRDFEDGLDDAARGVDDIRLPDGLTSTIWHVKNSIVKRDFKMTAGPSDDDLVQLKIRGIQRLKEDNQKWDYAIEGNDVSAGDGGVVSFTGDLNWKDDKASDSMKIVLEDMELTYNGKEELKGNERTFNRSLSFSDGFSEPALVWTGKAVHEKDSMKADHEFTLEGEDFGLDMVTLHVKQNGKIVKKVDMPDPEKKTVNIGVMTEEELEEFFERDIMDDFESWVMDLMGDLENELGY